MSKEQLAGPWETEYYDFDYNYVDPDVQRQYFFRIKDIKRQ
jgi:hypothetical protein